MTQTTPSTSRRLASLVLTLAVLSAGCIGIGEDTAVEPSQTDDAKPRPDPGDANGTQADTGGEATANASQQQDADANATTDNETSPQETPEPRTVEHAAGTTTIEGTTQRVVALEFIHVENVLALGQQPVGVADKKGYEKWVDAGIELDESVEDVGTRAEPNLEEIANLEPDLILAIEFRHAEIYDDLSEIAPTLLFQAFPGENSSDDQFDRMVSIFKRTATAMAEDARGREVLDGMREHFKTVKATLSEAGKNGREVLLSQLFTYQGAPLARVFLDTSIAVNVAERIGLENAWTKTACSTGYGYCDVSKEGFVDVQHADFFYQAQPNDDPVEDEWSDDPVWNSYEFVREDRVYALGADAWLFGGPLVTQEIAERIAHHYLD